MTPGPPEQVRAAGPALSAACLIPALETATVVSPPEAEITAVCQDSRAVRPGAAFVALPGGAMDGHAFLHHALANGASMLVVQDDHRGYWRELSGSGVGLVSVPDTRQALGRLAAAFHGYPSRQLTVIGVTGTDGKTTTALLTAGVLEAAGRSVAVLCTAGTRLGGELVPNDHHLTTPGAVEVQRFLARARDYGADCAVVEATSHGLAQGRLAALRPDVAVLTNVTRDHLDYHGSLDAYVSAKAHLFALLAEADEDGSHGIAVLNADDPASGTMRAAARASRHLSYGLGPAGDVAAQAVAVEGWHTSYRLRTAGRSVPVRLALPGRFNVMNSLAAAAVGHGVGADRHQIQRGLESVTRVPGRMQRIEAGQTFTTVVDYAHNAHELSQVLAFLRGITRGRVITVFGCAGDRDPQRRPAMGRVAARQSDYTVITSDDPWTEDPAAIAAEVAQGLAGGGRRRGHDYLIRLDRREAIAAALDRARDQDAVLVAGMGHERSMAVAGGTTPWDDALVVRQLIRGG